MNCQMAKLNDNNNARFCSVAFNHNDNILTSESWDNKIRLWDTTTGSLQNSKNSDWTTGFIYYGAVTSVAFNNENVVASGSEIGPMIKHKR